MTTELVPILDNHAMAETPHMALVELASPNPVTSTDSAPTAIVLKLFTALTLPIDLLTGLEITDEVVVLADNGLLEHAMLACAVVASARRVDVGPALAFGAWSNSRLIQQAAGDGDAADVGGDCARADRDFLKAIRDHEIGAPELLLPLAPDARLMERLHTALDDRSLAMTMVGPDAFRLTASPAYGRTNAGLESQAEALFAERLERPDSAVTLRISSLWRAVATARAIDLDIGGSETDTLPMAADTSAAQALLQSPWNALLPEMTPQLLGGLARACSSEETHQRWLQLLGEGITATTNRALRQRADMLWEVAAITARCPIAGYAGLLAGAGTQYLEPIVEAARLAGITVSSADPAQPAVLSRLDLIGENYAIIMSPERDSELEFAVRKGDNTAMAGRHSDTDCCDGSSRLVDVSQMLSESRTLNDGGVSLTVQFKPELGANALTVLPGANVGDMATDPSTAIVVHESWTIRVDRRLTKARDPELVDISLFLTGDRGADLSRITRLHDLLDRHPGPTLTRVILWRASFKKVTERSEARGVTLDADLRAELTNLLGPDCVRTESIATH